MCPNGVRRKCNGYFIVRPKEGSPCEHSEEDGFGLSAEPAQYFITNKNMLCDVHITWRVKVKAILPLLWLKPASPTLWLTNTGECLLRWSQFKWCPRFPQTRMQSLQPDPNAQYRGVYEALKRIIQTEGIFRPLRGLNVTMLGAGPAHALYFACYERVKYSLSDIIQNGGNSHVANGTVWVHTNGKYGWLKSLNKYSLLCSFGVTCWFMLKSAKKNFLFQKEMIQITFVQEKTTTDSMFFKGNMSRWAPSVNLWRGGKAII